MTTYSITVTAKQAAGFAAALTEFNATQPEGAAMTLDTYIAQRVGGLGDSYADQFECGAVPVGEFLRRFTGAEIDATKALALTDPMVAGLLAQIDAAPKGKVWLYSPTVQGGLAYIEGKSIAAGRAAVIGAV
jgi:hypothetical protein